MRKLLCVLLLLSFVVCLSGCWLLDFVRKAEQATTTAGEVIGNVPDVVLPPGGPQVKYGLLAALGVVTAGLSGLRTVLEKTVEGKEDVSMAVAKKENVLTRLMSSRKYVVALIAIVILVAAEKYTGINLGGEALVKSVLMLVLAPMAGNALEDAAEKLKVK